MSNPRKKLKNFPENVPGLSKELSTLRKNTLKSLRNWEKAQKNITRSRNKELFLQKAAADALKAYSDATIKSNDDKYIREEKSRIGTARNMLGYYHPTSNIPYNKLRKAHTKYNNSKNTRKLKRSRENSNEATKALSGIGLNLDFGSD